MKLNLCCGKFYLEGYENLDNKGRFIKEGEACSGLQSEIIKDGHLNLLLPWDGYEDNTVDEITVPISVIEKFSIKDAEFIMSEIERVLKPDGILVHTSGKEENGNN